MGHMTPDDEALIAEAKAPASLLGRTATEAETPRTFEATMAIAREASRPVPHGVTGNHADRYDAHGLPK